MRSLEEIERDLNEAREKLSKVEGRKAEVYSRIVGYYRSVCNWNKGKREEYGERKLFNVDQSLDSAGSCGLPKANKITGAGEKSPVQQAKPETVSFDFHAAKGEKLLLFVRPNCPHCPAVKAAAAKLGIYVETVNADTTEGFAEAAKYNVMATPMAILLSKDGVELARARDSVSISKFRKFLSRDEGIQELRKIA